MGKEKRLSQEKEQKEDLLTVAMKAVLSSSKIYDQQNVLSSEAAWEASKMAEIQYWSETKRETISVSEANIRSKLD